MLDTAVTSGTLIGPMEINHVLGEAAEAGEASSVVTMYMYAIGIRFIQPLVR